MSFEYATTVGRYDLFDGYVENPVPPDGDAWELIGSSAANHPERDLVRLFWFWRRQVTL